MRRLPRELGWAIVFFAWPPLAVGQTSEPVTLPSTVPDSMPTTVPDTTQATIPNTMPATVPDTEPATNSTTLPNTNPTTAASTEPATAPSTLPATTMPAMRPSTQPTTSVAVASTKPVLPDPTTMPTLTGVKDGTLFPDRVGRLWRAPGAREIQFIFDVDGKPTKAPLLPNLELMRLENAIAQDGWDQKFHASGRITEYKGRNFILLEHASRVGETESDSDAGGVR